MKKLIYEIKQEALILKQKTHEELAILVKKLKTRAQKEHIDDLLVEWFAITQEVAYRTIGLKHFDTQLVGGVLLHQGNIVEMKTGEGKTLVSTLPVSLNALTNKGVHVVTVNDYLAERDQKFMGKIYNKLGLTSGLVKSITSRTEKQKSYSSDITYVTNSELVFDFLRDSSAFNLDDLVQKSLNFCLVDEIDSILIDEARIPLILSTIKQNDNLNKLYLAKAIADILEKDVHFQLDEKGKEINLTESGYQETKKRLGKKTLYDPEDPWILDVLNALKAKNLFKRNKDYIILNNKIVIVDEFTGRIMEDRRWSSGLHEAIEIQEKLRVAGGTKTKSSITYQNFFTLYPKLAGMSGTAMSAEKEFKDIYNLNVIVLPTVKPLKRKDLPDFIYQTEFAKWKNVLYIAKQCFETGQPILIGTSTIEKSEFLSDLFKVAKIPHTVLNAKPDTVTQESQIIAQAGESFAVTIATNMAGRGTDIILGGNPEFKIKKKLNEIFIQQGNSKEEFKDILKDYTSSVELQKDIQNLPYSLENCKVSLKIAYNYIAAETFPQWEKENQRVKDLGGLFVLGTERHETRRIDDQLRGRSGRQGDPGISQFLVSLDDDIIKIFGGESIKKWMRFLIKEEEEPLKADLLTKSLENAQSKIENHNYNLRKNIFEYDNLLNAQRKQIYKARKDLLLLNNYEEITLRLNETGFDEIKQNSLNTGDSIAFLENKFGNYVAHKFGQKIKKLSKKETKNKLLEQKDIWIGQDLRLAESNFYEPGFLKTTRSNLLLNVIDFYWTEHLEKMSYTRETINWRSYGQQNPLIEYNNEAVKSFKLMLEQIRICMLYYFLNNPINYS
jgi:preprotein translocase subunit SecA